MSVLKQKQKSERAVCFIDYKPAQLHKKKDWIIRYYIKNPITETLVLKRLRVPKYHDKKIRLIEAKKIVDRINTSLANGEIGFGKSDTTFKRIDSAGAEFLKSIEKKLRDGVMRADSLRTYSSNLNLFNKYLAENCPKIEYVLQINRVLCVNYLDWIYNERESSPRTRNNHLIFLKLFCSYLLDRGYLEINPATSIKTMPKEPKKREIFPPELRQKIVKNLLQRNDCFYCVCMTTYYELLRNTELSKIKVRDIDLDEKCIFVSAEISKNKKSEFLTILEPFWPIITNHIAGAEPDMFVFSSNNFKPGFNQMPTRKIGTAFEKLRAEIGFSNKYQFYSFKDTGITDLLNSGIAALKVRDHARHSDLKITEIYAKRQNIFDSVLNSANVNFY